MRFFARFVKEDLQLRVCFELQGDKTLQFFIQNNIFTPEALAGCNPHACYPPNPKTIEELISNIRTEVANIPVEIIRKACLDLKRCEKIYLLSSRRDQNQLVVCCLVKMRRPTIRMKEEIRLPRQPSNVRQQEKEKFIGQINNLISYFFIHVNLN